MITDEKTGEVITSGNQQTARFSIKMGGKAFKLMFAGIYSDPIRAIIRELIANGIDSHKMAGCPDRPVKVTLPSRLDEMFAVRDYGVSMTHDFIMTRFSTAMDSTKDESNDEIGGFGLGGKTPFVYTDMFQIRCFLDREVRLYTAYLNEQGWPCVSLMNKSPTDEENGVEVSFPVKPQDNATFEAKAAYVCATLPVRPECKSSCLKSTLEELDAQRIAINGDCYLMCYNHTFPYGIYAVMGGIPYPIDLRQLNLPNVVKERIGHYMSGSFFINFDIGELLPTPSRESLQFTDETKAALVKKLTKVCLDIHKIVEDVMKDTTLYGRLMFRYQGYYDRSSADVNGANERKLRNWALKVFNNPSDYGKKSWHFGRKNHNIDTLVSAMIRVARRFNIHYYRSQRAVSEEEEGCIYVEDKNGDQVGYFVYNGKIDFTAKEFYYTKDNLSRSKMAAISSRLGKRSVEFLLNATPRRIELLRRAMGSPTEDEVKFIDMDVEGFDKSESKVKSMPVMFAAAGGSRNREGYKWKRVNTTFISRTNREVVMFVGEVNPVLFGKEMSRGDAEKVMRAINNFQGLPGKKSCAYVFVPKERVEKFKGLVKNFTTIDDKIMSILGKKTKEEWQELLYSDRSLSTYFAHLFFNLRMATMEEGSKAYSFLKSRLNEKALSFFVNLLDKAMKESDEDETKQNNKFINFFNNVSFGLPKETEIVCPESGHIRTETEKECVKFFETLKERNPLLYHVLKDEIGCMKPTTIDRYENVMLYLCPELNGWFPDPE